MQRDNNNFDLNFFKEHVLVWLSRQLCSDQILQLRKTVFSWLVYFSTLMEQVKKLVYYYWSRALDIMYNEKPAPLWKTETWIFLKFPYYCSENN